MKLIYSGGWNNKDEASIKASFMYSYHTVIKDAASSGKKIAMVTLAKEDGHYDNLIVPLYSGLVEVINIQTKSVEWDRFDGIFILGGKSSFLKTNLEKVGFDLKKLKDNVVVLGDSAGSYILSSYFYQSPPGERRGVDMVFMEGFNPGAKLITIAHKHNPVYCNESVISKVNAFAQEKGLKVLMLEENEQKTPVDGIFVDVDKHSLFTS